MIRIVLIAAAVFAVVPASLVATPAVADDTGLAGIHDLRRERGRLCMSDHWHYGNGTGSSRKAAEVDAIKSWQSFTALEYGSDWGRFSRASGRRISCSKEGGSYACSVEGRPCR